MPNKSLTTSIPEDTKTALEQRAKQSSRSLSAVAAEALTFWVKASTVKQQESFKDGDVLKITLCSALEK